MSDHPIIPLDEALVSEVAARLELRRPNEEALGVVAARFDEAEGNPFEAVCDLATAVGKTYLAAGIIEYLAEKGVRNFLIVVPGRTIREKTVNNFTAGSRKSLVGNMEVEPDVITIDNFNRGSVANALHDQDRVKLYIFTVQSLIKPKKADRRARKQQEWLGEDLYEFLRTTEDLVVLADESHVYSEKAQAFSEAIRELGAMAVIGLTATPTAEDAPNVIYHYPLARAIADRYVKTPVLVGRRDSANDVETRLRDGKRLLEAKQAAADAYSSATGAASVNAVMFVVAGSIDNANAIAETLRRPDLFADTYDDAVLTIHSDSSDDSLARLASVEDPDSKVRVIVSVSMLKEGWDVKNIFVICSFRPSISEVLTEQTLGRGLRLPWNEYTDVELLDTVEVLSHESYKRLLEQAGALLEGLTEQRSQVAIVPTSGAGDPNTQQPSSTDTGVVVAPVGGPISLDVPTSSTDAAELADAVQSSPADLPAGTTGLVITPFDQRTASAAEQAQALTEDILPSTTLEVPRVLRTVKGRSFKLSDLADPEFESLGRRIASVGGTTLQRKKLVVVADPQDPGRLDVVPTDADDAIAAAAPTLPFGGVQAYLADSICLMDLVPDDRAGRNAAKRLASAVVRGAGGEDFLAAHLNAASDGCRRLVTAAYRSADELVEERIATLDFGAQRTNARPKEMNRFGPFSPKVAYGGWRRSMHPLNWFDSSPERALANTLDSDDQVAVWARILRHEDFVIAWRGGIYTPDLLVVSASGDRILIEVKADRDIDLPDVIAKRAEAERWARFVTDAGDYGSWRYVFAPESDANAADSLTSLLTRTSV